MGNERKAFFMHSNVKRWNEWKKVAGRKKGLYKEIVTVYSRSQSPLWER